MDIRKQVNDVMKSHAFLNYCADRQVRTDAQKCDIVENIAVKVLRIPKGIYSRQVALMTLYKAKTMCYD